MADASIRVDAKVDTSQMQKLQIQIDKTSMKIEELSKKYKDLESTKTPTNEFAELEGKLKSAQTELQKLNTQKAEFASMGFGEDMLSGINREISEAKTKIAEITASMKKLGDEGKDFTIGANPEKIEEVANKLSLAQAELKALNTRKVEMLSAEFEKAAKSSKKCFKTIQDGTKKSNGMLSTFGTRLKGIALSLFIFNWITKAFNAMVSAMKEGFQNLAQYSGEYNQSMSELKSELATLKNSLAAAFEPIANLIIPYLSQLVSWLNTALETVSKFLAVLQGKSSYTRAKKQTLDYAKSLDTASKSAKRALASFDELNVLSKNDDSSKPSSGEMTGGDAFETVQLTEEDMQIVDVLKEKLQSILAILILIGVAMAVFGVGGPLATFAGLLLTVVGLLEFILEYMDAWANGISFDNLQGMLVGLLAVITGIFLLFGPMAAGLAAIVGGIALVVLAIKDMLENGVNMENCLTLIIGIVVALVAVFLLFGSTVGTVVAAIVAVIGILAAMIAIAGNGGEAIETLKRIFSNFADFFKRIFAGDIEGALDSLVNVFKDMINFVLIEVESFINCIIKGLNWLIEKINTISFDVPDWVPIIGGKTMGFNIPSIQEVSLPRLAKGAVIQGGKPFAAILGDQPAGQTNIETPLATMVDAFKQAMAETGGAGGSYTFVAQLDGRTIFNETVRQEHMQYKATGRGAFQH